MVVYLPSTFTLQAGLNSDRCFFRQGPALPFGNCGQSRCRSSLQGELAIVDLALASTSTASTIAATAAMPSTLTIFIPATPLFSNG